MSVYTPPKKLVCFVEGTGDLKAVPLLARRVLKWIGAHDVLVGEDDPPGPTRVQNIGNLIKTDKGKKQPNWHRWLVLAGHTSKPLGGVLLVLDGDESKPLTHWKAYTQQFNTAKFCARDAARLLAHDARSVRAGVMYSVGVVFVVKEFETWLLAGLESLRGIVLSDGLSRVPDDATCPDWADFELPRDAKGELRKTIPQYKERTDQSVLANVVSLEAIHDKCPSFRRFCSAIEQMAVAIRTGQHVSTP